MARQRAGSDGRPKDRVGIAKLARHGGAVVGGHHKDFSGAGRAELDDSHFWRGAVTPSVAAFPPAVPAVAPGVAVLAVVLVAVLELYFVSYTRCDLFFTLMSSLL